MVEPISEEWFRLGRRFAGDFDSLVDAADSHADVNAGFFADGENDLPG